MKAFLNASQVAKLLGYDRATIIRWIHQGVIKGAIQSSKGRKDWQIPLSAYQELSKQKQL
jgi:predicted site-specific integrase-resolvase